MHKYSATLKILIVVDWFAPGYKAGGPIQSCVNFAYLMQNDYEIYVLTSDRDLGDTKAYDGIQSDKWLEFDQNIMVLYASPQNLKISSLRKRIMEVSPQFIYLNSMFSPYFTILPLFLNFFMSLRAKVVLAPRGMLKSSAIQYKSFKKKLFLSIAKGFSLLKNVSFHATDSVEVEDIRHYFPATREISLISNPPRSSFSDFARIDKQAYEIKLLFVGRIHPIKNLGFLLNALSGIDSKYAVKLTIVGQIEHNAYWSFCQDQLKKLPPHVKVEYLGAVPHHLIDDYIKAHHFFVLPTSGENFGHAIFESFLNGRPVIISDQTPWRSLEQKKVGWELPLQNPENWKNTIMAAADLSQSDFDELCEAAKRFAKSYISDSEIKSSYKKLFS